MLKQVNKRPKAAKADAPPKERYLEDGATWEYDQYRSLQASRTRAWTVAVVAMGFAGLSMLALLLLLPLKQFEPYVITVDKSTGFIEMTRGLHPGPLTQDEAITQSFVVRYLTARETYDPPDQQQNYDLVKLFSEGNALREYQNVWASSNPENPSRTYGYKVQITVQIKSITFLNDRTASVRFQRTRIENGQTQISHWGAILGFRYVDRPILQKDRFQNPLGFQVGSYRIDQEALE